MATTFSIVQGARLPSLEFQAFDRSGPLNLSDASSPKFFMSSPDDGQVVDGATAVIVNGAAGVIRYDWGTSDTATPGEYRAQFEVTKDGKKLRFPTNDHIIVRVTEDA